jgi:predicted metal-dependent HD superfamily phosphohydrolase
VRLGDLIKGDPLGDARADVVRSQQPEEPLQILREPSGMACAHKIDRVDAGALAAKQPLSVRLEILARQPHQDVKRTALRLYACRVAIGAEQTTAFERGKRTAISVLSDAVEDNVKATGEDAGEIYTGPDRHYHDLRHINGMLALAAEHGPEITDGEAVEAAIWFHDAVYDTRRGDNEAESAKLATQTLSGVTAVERLEFIAAMIPASAKRGIPDSIQGAAAKDCALFLDMDVAILGSAAEEFDAYERAVRLEYGWVPEEAWITGRAQVLRNFLARPFIYATRQFRKSHEAPARSNLSRSLARLEGNLRS